MKQPRMDFLPSPELLELPELWYQQQPIALICLLGECIRVWVSPCSQISRIGWDSQFYLPVEQVTSPLPVWKILRWGVKYLEHTHSWSRHWVGLSGKILGNSQPIKRYWVRAWLKDAQGDTHPVARFLGWSGEGWWGRDSIETYRGIPRARLKDTEVAPL